MAELSVGGSAPSFELPYDSREAVRLADFAGRPLVLFFYPKDDTPACTDEALAFSALKPEFDRLGVGLLGISPDTPRRHANFRRKYALTVDLASDPERSVLQAYGVWGEKTLFGRRYMGVLRTTLLIGADGRVARIWRDVRVPGHAEEVLAAAAVMAQAGTV